MNIEKLYVIKISLKNKSCKWVSIDRYNRFSTVSTKKAALKFLCEGSAHKLSNYFWETAWDRENFEIREVEEVKVRS